MRLYPVSSGKRGRWNLPPPVGLPPTMNRLDGRDSGVEGIGSRAVTDNTSLRLGERRASRFVDRTTVVHHVSLGNNGVMAREACGTDRGAYQSR